MLSQHRAKLEQWLSDIPTVGSLMELCEENYRALVLLVPSVRMMSGDYCSAVQGAQDLYLQVLEQTQYTSLVHLTHVFIDEAGDSKEPDIVVRLYHDATQAEVLEVGQGVMPVIGNYFPPALRDKWRANVFLSKWLAYCRHQGHGFYF